jgi:hypothetical protein
MTTGGRITDYQEAVRQWYEGNNDRVQQMIGSMIRRKGDHGEGIDEMRAELNYWICRHVTSAARRGKAHKVVLSMTVDYAYRRWSSGERSYHKRQGRHDLGDEPAVKCRGDEWQFPAGNRPGDPAQRARYHLDMQMIGKRLSPKAQRVFREFIKNPYATDKHVCAALGQGWRTQYVFHFRQIIKKALAAAGYYPSAKRRVEATPEIESMGPKVVCIYGACQRTPNASYAAIARQLGCQRSHVRWALHRFVEVGVPWAEKFVANNAQERCQRSRKAPAELAAAV